MNFSNHISGLPELQDFEVTITLENGESITIENIEGKQASLRLLQAHLAGANETSNAFRLEDFCEYYEQWKQEPDGHHTTIAFLDRYNREGGIIQKK